MCLLVSDLSGDPPPFPNIGTMGISPYGEESSKYLLKTQTHNIYNI